MRVVISTDKTKEVIEVYKVSYDEKLSQLTLYSMQKSYVEYVYGNVSKHITDTVISQLAVSGYSEVLDGIKCLGK